MRTGHGASVRFPIVDRRLIASAGLAGDPPSTGGAMSTMHDPIRCSVFVGTSVDGFIARTNGGLDWLPPGGGEEHGYTAFMATVDAIVMGRDTFDAVLAFDRWPFEKPVIVLTTHDGDASVPPGARVEFMSGAPRDVVWQLAERGLTHLYVDGGVTIQRFLNAGLIDRM